MDEWKQGSFQFPGMYKKSKWMFTCICRQCLRIFEVPAGIFLQGDPICACGCTHITANHESRLLMAELQDPDRGPIEYNGRKIKTWSKENGATFEE